MSKKFSWDDREKSFTPCDYCAVDRIAPLNETAMTHDVCDRCDYNIILHCLNSNPDTDDETAETTPSCASCARHDCNEGRWRGSGADCPNYSAKIDGGE